MRALLGYEKISTATIEVFKEKNLDFTKFAKRCAGKNIPPVEGLANVLLFSDMGLSLEQCDCGEVIGLPDFLVDKVKSYYYDGKVRCPKCDPSLDIKLEEDSTEMYLPWLLKTAIDKRKKVS